LQICSYITLSQKRYKLAANISIQLLVSKISYLSCQICLPVKGLNCGDSSFQNISGARRREASPWIHRPRKHGVRGGQLSRVWGQVMLFDPHFFMHKSMAGSLYTEGSRCNCGCFYARKCTNVVLDSHGYTPKPVI